MQDSIVILIPVYNDWESLKILITNLKGLLSNRPSYQIVIIDDGSVKNEPILSEASLPIRIITLRRNVGHQKAIAIGLAYIHHHIDHKKILIMDGDGEDRPEDVLSLLDASQQNPEKLIFAHRSSRAESLSFQIFYTLYKVLFRIMTGKSIAYGNFMVLPKRSVQSLVYHNEIWNHLSAAIIKSDLPFIAIQTARGKRYTGKSKMNFTSLLLHGFGAISVFIEQMATRLLILSISLMIISIIAIGIIVGIKWFTHLAIPGWASTIALSMVVVLLQGILLSLFTLFLYLSSQSNRKFIPALHYTDYTGNSENIIND